MVKPLDVLGTRLKVEFQGDYAGGILTDSIAGEQIAQSNTDARPTLATTPGGASVLHFDGNDSFLTADPLIDPRTNLATLAALPAFGTGQRLHYFILKVPQVIEGNHGFLWNFSNQGVLIGGYSGFLNVSGQDNGGNFQQLNSDIRVDDDVWHRCIIICDEATNTTRLYIDGNLQSTVGAFPFGQSTQWGAGYVGCGSGVVGLWGQVGFAYSETTFSSTDIENLDAALLAVIGSEIPSGEMQATISGTSTVTATIHDASAPPASTVKTPQDVLTTRLVVEFRGDLVDNVLTDAIAGEKLGRSDAPVLPVLDETPGGKNIVKFEGYYLASNDSSVSPNTHLVTLANLPAIGTGQRLLYFIIKAPPVVDNTFGYIWSFGTTDVMINGFGGTLRVDYKIGAYPRVESDVRIDDDTWHRCMVIGDELNGLTYLIVDGVLQSSAGSFVMGAPSDWGAVGINHGAIQGVIGQTGFAYTPTTFSAQDVVDLDTALISVIEGTRVPDVLGERLVLYYGGNYIPSTGVWTPTVGTSELVQATPDSRPALGITPVGNNVLSLDGINDSLTTVGNNTGIDRLAELQSLPAVGTGQRLFCAIFKAAATTARQILYRAGGNEAIGIDIYGSGDYRLRVIGAYPNVDAVSDNELNDDAWHRIIVVGDDATRNVTIYIDGIAQSNVGNFTTRAFGDPAEWGAYGFSFGQTGTFYWDGELGSLGFAYTDTAFSLADIENLDTALNLLIVPAPSQISATIAGTSSVSATISSSGTPAVTIATILSSSPTTSFRWYKDYIAGTWTDTEGTGNATQELAQNQPSVGVTNGGQSYPDFDGAALPNHDVLILPAWSTAPTHSSSHHAAFGFLFRCDSIPGAGNAAFIVVSDTYLHYINSDGRLNLASGAMSNASIVGTGWHRAIAVKNGSTGVVTLYLDGVAQSSTSTADMDSDWNVSHRIGERDATGNYRYDGGLASMFFAIDTTTAFSSQTITDLDEALRVVLEGDGYSGAIESTINNTSSVSAIISASGQLSSTISNTSSVIANINGLVPLNSTIDGTSTLSGTISGSGVILSTINNTSEISASIIASGTSSTTIDNSSEISAILHGAGSISAVISGTSTVNATIASVIPGSATITNTSTVSAGISAIGRTTTTINGSSTVDAKIDGAGAISATILGTSTTSATSSTIISRSASITGTSSIEAEISALADASVTIDNTSSVNASISSIANRSVTINNGSIIDAEIFGLGSISTTIQGTSSVTASTDGTIFGSATINNTSTVAASVSAIASSTSTINNTSTVNAQITAVGSISAQITGSSEVTATPNEQENFANISGTSTVTATIRGSLPGSANIDTSSFVNANIAGSASGSSNITGASSVIATVRGNTSNLVTINNSSSVTAEIIANGQIEALINATSTLVATPNLRATLTGSSTLTAQIRGDARAQSNITATSDATANLIANGGLVSVLNGTSTVVANALGTARGSATIAGTSALTVIPNGTVLLEATINNGSTITASIIGIANTTSNIDGFATIQASLIGSGALNSTVANTSTFTASILGRTSLNSQIHGTSDVSASLAIRALGEALIANSSTVSAQLQGRGQVSTAISGTSSISLGQLRGTASGNAVIENTSKLTMLVFSQLQAAINNTSSLRATIFNYLEDKRIDNIDNLDKSGIRFPRTLIPREISNAHIPIVPSQPEPTTPVYDPSIQKSGQRLGIPQIPVKINKSDGSI